MPLQTGHQELLLQVVMNSLVQVVENPRNLPYLIALGLVVEIPPGLILNKTCRVNQ